MRVAWFSPLPPVRSGIATYSAELLPRLGPGFDVDCYVEGGSGTFSYARGAPHSLGRWGPTPSAVGSGLPLARRTALSAAAAVERERARQQRSGWDPTAIKNDSLSSRGPQALARVTYDQLFRPAAVSPHSVTAAEIGDVLRHALGLSAWKQFHESRWSLRVNPSSGNLHPTEAYIVTGPVEDLSDTPAVWHYAADRHLLELRCAFDMDAWRAACGDRSDVWLVALMSIHWREAWKYGERAFRYCQHDLGHAIASVRIAAALSAVRRASGSPEPTALGVGPQRPRKCGAPRALESACGPREDSESLSAAARASGGGAPRALENVSGNSGAPTNDRKG